ncbi:MAG: LemA family protein [Eubacteriales bacterium]
MIILVIGLIFLCIIIVLVTLSIKYYNNFVVLKNRVLDQQAQIDVQLKRRCDLIPNLIQTVKGSANFEKSTLEAVTNARTKALHAANLNDVIQTNNELSGALRNFFAVSENYPDLKSNASFLQLQSEFSTTEDKIAKSRQFFNDTVMKYNTALELFPANIFAKIFGYQPFAYLTAEESEKQSIKMDDNTFQF